MRRHVAAPVWGMALVAVGVGSVGAGRTTEPATIRVASYNIKHGRGNDNVVDLARTAGVLRALAPDIVGLQEVDREAERSGKVDEARVLGESLGVHHAFGRFMDFQGGAYGMGVLSRFPITARCWPC